MNLLLALSGCSGPGVDQIDRLRVAYIHGNLEEARFAQVVVDGHSCAPFEYLDGSTLNGVSPRSVETVQNAKVPDPDSDGTGVFPEMATDCGYSVLHFDLALQDRQSGRADLVLSGAEEDLNLELFGSPFRAFEFALPEEGWTQPWVDEIELTLNRDILDTEQALVTATVVEEETGTQSQSDPLLWRLQDRTLLVNLDEALQTLTPLRVTELTLSGFEYSYLSCPADIDCSVRGSTAVGTP